MNFLVLIEIAGFPRACHILYIYNYISREISIEHPSVGLASLAQ